MKIPRTSFSSCDTFANCEMRYYLDKSKPRTPDTPQQARGSHVHNLLELTAKRAHLRIIDGGLKDSTWATALDQTLEQASNGALEGPLKHEVLTSYGLRVLPFLEGCIPEDDGVERWFQAIKDQECCGKIDLVSQTTPILTPSGQPTGAFNDQPCVIDYKTMGPNGRPKDIYECRRSLQLQLYCLATGARTGMFIFIPPRSNPTGVVVEFKDEQLNQTLNWLRSQRKAIANRWRQIEDGQTPDRVWSLAHPSWFLCSEKWCAHWSECIGKATKGAANG